jgi:hypothetical protein
LRRAGRERASALRLSAPAAGVALLTLLFIAISVWWVLEDKRVLDGDQTRHIGLSFYYYEQLLKGHRLFSFRYEVPNGALYPPFFFQIGMLGALIGGKSVNSPVIAQNLFFVPLYAIASYRAGSIAYNRLTGLLAVAFAFGTPMMISQFHMFMPDMPLAALVVASIWLLLESRRFERRWICVAAGVALGVGLLTKQSFPFFVLPFFAVFVLRGGWRNWVNVLLVAGVALAIAAPWYLDHIHRLQGVATEATAQVDNPWGSEAPRFSVQNYTWYGWNLVNRQLLLPLTLFLLFGAVLSTVSWLRRRRPDDYTPELIAGAVGSLVITALVFGYHDPRYTFPGIIFMALLGTGWITTRRGRLRPVLLGLFAAVVLLNTLTVNLGVLGQHKIPVPGGEPTTVAEEHRLTVITNYGYVIGKPETAGDMERLMRAAERDGITQVVVQDNAPFWLDPAGIGLFATIIGMNEVTHPHSLGRNGMYVAELPLTRGMPRPCTTMPDGGGVYFFRGDPKQADPKTARNLYCPRGARTG